MRLKINAFVFVSLMMIFSVVFCSNALAQGAAKTDLEVFDGNVNVRNQVGEATVTAGNEIVGISAKEPMPPPRAMSADKLARGLAEMKETSEASKRQKVREMIERAKQPLV